jgi:agmatine deiminase
MTTTASTTPPAEWEAHSALWTAWPADGELWLENLAPAQAEVAGMIRALAASHSGRAGDRVRVLAHGAEGLKTARAAVGDVADVVPGAYGDIWLRDTGPIFLDARRCLGFIFNGWGGKYVLDHDDTVSTQVAKHSGAELSRIAKVLEGGAIDWDGEGTVVTTRECLLNDNRNPGMSEADVEKLLKDTLGLSRVIWIDEGLLNDHTDGHVDNIARFIAPGVIACQSPADGGDPHGERLEGVARALEGQRDARGRLLKVVRIPAPGFVAGFDDEDEPAPASHMNFIIGNATVVVPTYGTASAQAAVDALKPWFPGRNVVGLPSYHVLSGGGSFHCITQQQPA